jgi:glycosyltransferase involved in cell wall biosynthesis
MSGRILLVLPSFGAGGAERVVVTLANHLLATAWRPTIVVLDDGDGPLRSEVRHEVTVTALGRRRLRSALTPLVRHVRATSPDALLGTHAHVNLALAAARGLLPSQTLLLLREPLHVPASTVERERRAIRRAQRRLYRRADLVLATSRAMADDLVALTGARVAQLANPVDVAGLRSRVQQPAEVPPRGGRRFVVVARLVPQKAVGELLLAYAEGGRAGDELLVIGDGPERPLLERLTRSLPLQGDVRFLGRSDAPWSAVAQADVLVIASRLEGMPNAALEALAVGTPVLAVDDLPMLRELATQSGPGAVTVVPRAELGTALASTQVRTTSRPGPSLLPDAYMAPTVAGRFIDLLAAARSARHTGEPTPPPPADRSAGR